MSSLQTNFHEKFNASSLQIIADASAQPPSARSSQVLIIVERKEDWASYLPSEDMLTAREYLEDSRQFDTGKRLQVINLCRHYKYLGHGYYCSLGR